MKSCNDQKWDVIIVGAGVTGLTIAHKLCSEKFQTILTEKESEVGGLARSFRYGDFTFDIGPHGFFRTEQRIEDYIKKILGDELLKVPKKSSVKLLNKYYDWPLGIRSVIKLPFRIKVKAFLDMIYRKHYVGSSLREYLLNYYGKTLFYLNFEPYNKKFLNRPMDQTHPDWMKIGMKRAGAGEKLKMNNLWQVFFSIFAEKAEYFYYPKSGIGVFSKILEKKINDLGGKILKNAEITAVTTNENRIKSITCNNIEYNLQTLIWTGPITEINRLVYGVKADSGLGFLPMIFYNVEVNEKPETQYRWFYLVDDDVIFPRCSIPTLFSSKNSPEGKMGVCVELTCHKNNERWRHPEKYVPAIIEGLQRTRLIKDKRNVQAVHIEKVEHAYPIYSLDYRNVLNNINKKLGKFDNLILAGRQGTFWYNNMNHSIGMGLEIATKLIQERFKNSSSCKNGKTKDQQNY